MARILLVEPDKLLAENLKKYLKTQGWQVSWQPDPQGAINSADRHPPSVVVMDLSLGPHNGVEFLYEFRSYPEWLTVPVVIYTNLSAQELVDLESSFEELGVNAYHYKPATSLDQLVGTIQHLADAVPA